ncbi:ribosome maturation protein [Xylariaceae sp. FL1019]|nr:ribosome maturation protein [Xylariaceae sp. FL1019]
MTKGEAGFIKVHLGREKTKTQEDFVVMIQAEYEKEYEEAKSSPDGFTTELLNLLTPDNDFAVFETNKHGAQGHMNRASKQKLAAAFGTENHEECYRIVLKDGTKQGSQMPGRQGPKNDSQMGSIVNGQPGTR